MRQIIIARKDLNMTPGKLAAQVAHASMAFMSTWIRNHADWSGYIEDYFPEDIYTGWVLQAFTKTICEAKNRNQLMKAVGRTLTCIGFRPLDDEIAWKISKKFQLYK